MCKGKTNKKCEDEMFEAPDHDHLSFFWLIGTLVQKFSPSSNEYFNKAEYIV